MAKQRGRTAKLRLGGGISTRQMSDKLADHPHLPVLLLPILPLPSSCLTCVIFFSFWYAISNPPPEKNGLQTSLSTLHERDLGSTCMPFPHQTKKDRRPLFLSLRATRERGLKPPSIPFWPKSERNSKPPPHMFWAKEVACWKKPAPLPFWPKEGEFKPPHLPSHFISSALSLSLIPTLDHEPSRCPP